MGSVAACWRASVDQRSWQTIREALTLYRRMQGDMAEAACAHAHVLCRHWELSAPLRGGLWGRDARAELRLAEIFYSAGGVDGFPAPALAAFELLR